MVLGVNRSSEVQKLFNLKRVSYLVVLMWCYEMALKVLFCIDFTHDFYTARHVCGSVTIASLADLGACLPRLSGSLIWSCRYLVHPHCCHELEENHPCSQHIHSNSPPPTVLKLKMSDYGPLPMVDLEEGSSLPAPKLTEDATPTVSSTRWFNGCQKCIAFISASIIIVPVVFLCVVSIGHLFFRMVSPEGSPMASISIFSSAAVGVTGALMWGIFSSSLLCLLSMKYKDQQHHERLHRLAIVLQCAVTIFAPWLGSTAMNKPFAGNVLEPLIIFFMAVAGSIISMIFITFPTLIFIYVWGDKK